MKKIVYYLIAFLLMFAWEAGAQVLNPNDAVVTYDPLNPPARPTWGNIGKWVRTKRVSWNTDNYKAYIYKNTPFRLIYPSGYVVGGNNGKKFPMIVFLHGAGENMNTIYDNEFQLKNGAQRHQTAVLNGTYPGFVIFPHTFGGWGDGNFADINDIINFMVANTDVDPNRVVVHGLSQGGKGTWEYINAHPRVFAGAAPMSGIIGDNAGIERFKFMPIWLSQGGQDKNPTPAGAQAWVNEINSRGGNIRFTLYPELGHSVWDRHYNEPDFFPFLLRANRTNPWALYGRFEFCPGEPVNTTLGVAAGFDEYEWRKDGQVIVGAKSNTLQVTEYGTYDVRIRYGTVWSYWSPIPAVIKEKSTTVTPPIEMAALGSRLVPSPDGKNTVLLTMPEGYAQYEWRNASNQAVVGTGRTFAAPPGEYIAIVTEQFGCSSFPSQPYRVINANGPNAPSPASNLSATALSKTDIALFWSENPNAQFNETGFEIYRATSASGPFQFVALTAANVVTYTDQDLNPNTTYHYVVRAVNETAASNSTAPASATTEADTQAPSVPLNLRIVSISPTEAELAWEPSTDDVGIFRYEVFRNGARAAITEETSATVYNLVEEQTYNFTVKARDVSGNLSVASNQVTATAVFSGLNYKYFEGTWSVLPNFNNLTPVATGNSANVDLNVRLRDNNFGVLWEGFISIPVAGSYTFETNSDDGSKLYIGDYNFSGAALVNNDGSHGMQFREGTYVFNQPGYYPIAIAYFQGTGGRGMEVYWKNTAHGVTTRQRIPNSAFVKEVTLPDVPPTAPSGLTASAIGHDRVQLTWNDASTNETGFEIFRATNIAGPFVKIGGVKANITTFTDTGLQPSTTYFYQLRSIGQYGESVLVGTLPTRANWLFNNNYSDATNNGHTGTPANGVLFNATHKVEGSHSMFFDGSNDLVNVGGTNTGFLHDAFTQWSVAFWMKANLLTNTRIIYDQGGSDNGMAFRINASKLEVGIASANVRRLLSVPFTSTDWVHVAAVFNRGTLTLYLNGVQAAQDSNLGFTGVNFTSNNSRLGSNNGNNAFNNNGSAFGGYLDDFRVLGVALTVEDIQAVRTGTDKNPIATTAPLPAPPSVPTNLAATAIAGDKIALSWQDNSNNETQFQIYRSLAPNANYRVVATVPADSTTYTDSGLFVNVTYYYKIEAVGIGGSNGHSSVASATTPNNLPTLAGISPFTMKAGTNFAISLLATDPNGEAITLSMNVAPSFASLTDNGNGTGQILFTPASTDLGSYQFTVIATDAFNGVDTKQVTFVVNNNNLPTIQSVTAQTVAEGAVVTQSLTASDLDNGQTISWSGVGLPSFVQLNDLGNGTASLRIAPWYVDAGSHTLTVRATDSEGGQATLNIPLTVTDVEPNVAYYVNFSHGTLVAAPWNNIRGVNTANLRNSAGTTTNVGLNMLTTSWKTWNEGGVTGNNSGYFPDAVLREYYYFGIFGAPPAVNMEMVNLDPQRRYRFTFMASSRWSGAADNGTTIFKIGATSVPLAVQNNTQNVAIINNVAPDANGRVLVEMSRLTGTAAGYINGMLVESILDDGSAPVAPDQLIATANTNGTVTLTWRDVPFNETGFEVYRGESVSGEFTLLNPNPRNANTTSYLDATAGNGKTYFYKLRAVNANGSSPETSLAQISIPNIAPVWNAIGEQVAVIGTPTLISVTATDRPAAEIVLSGSGLPAFATFNDLGNGQGSILVQATAAHIGEYNFSLIATDAQGASASRSVRLLVLPPVSNRVYFNFTRNTAAPAPWNNAMKAPAVGDRFNNLLDQQGNPSGIGIRLPNAWGGVNPAGAVTGNNSGIVPDAVLSEYYWTGTFGAPASADVVVTGLDPARKYNFRFAGSSVFAGGGITDNGETQYTIGSRSVSLYVQGNTSRMAAISNVAPNASGEVTITISRGAGATVAYINGLVIEALEPVAQALAPTDLTARAASKTSIRLRWSDESNVETGFEVYRSSLPDGPFQRVTTLGANATGFVDTGLASGAIYYYKVRATFANEVFSDFTETASAGTLIYSVMINMNGDAAYNAPAPWNNMVILPSDGDMIIGLKDDRGKATSMVMRWVKTFEGSNDWGMNTGNNSGVVPDAVLRSFFWINDVGTSKVVIEGLDQGMAYNFVFNSSINVDFSVRTRFTINGRTVIAEGQANTQNNVSIDGVIVDENNTVTIDITGDASSRWSIWNALIIEAAPRVLGPNERRSQSPAEIAYTGRVIDLNNPVADASLLVYPNPMQETVYVRYQSLESAQRNVQFRLFDMAGRTIGSTNLQVDSANGTLPLPFEVGSLQGGLYLLEVRMGNGDPKVFKLFKN